MDKEYTLIRLEERIELLRNRLRLVNHCKGESGEELSTKAAYKLRYETKKNLGLCKLVYSLILKPDTIWLQDDLVEALEQLMEPCERHRRLRNG